MTNNLVGVRDYLRGLGLDNDQIGWNQQTGMVQYGGKDFLRPTEAYGGKSYANTTDIMNALKTNNIPYQSSAAGYNNSVQNILGQLTNKINQPFNYNPTKDPAYISAQAAAKRNAKTASKGAMEELNARGILNSTVTSDRLGQIQDEAEQRVTDLIPSLMANAYGRQQNDTTNLMSLLGTYTNLENNAYNRDMSERQFQAQLQKDENYMNLQTQQLDLQRKQQEIDNAITKLNTLGYVDNEISKITGFPVGTPSAQARQAAEELKNRIKLAGIEAGNRMAAIEKEYSLRAIENEKENALRTAAEDKERTQQEQKREDELRSTAAKMATDTLGQFNQDLFNQIYNALKNGGAAPAQQEGLSDLFNP